MDYILAQAIFKDTFSHVNAFKLSTEERKRRNISDSSLTYGEITFDSFNTIINMSQVKNGVFYDLGSGIGKALVAASLLGNFEKIVGVEILDDVFAASQDVITSYKNNVRENVCKNIEIIHGDIRNVAIDKADLVYVASTCFDESFMLHLSKKAETMKKGAIDSDCNPHSPGCI